LKQNKEEEEMEVEKNKIRNTIPNDIEMNRIDFSVAHYISSHKKNK
jgi:hypothetical protein